MAEIFLARAHKSDAPERLVVVKRIRPALADLASFVDMFLDEARLAATLHHPNIVKVCDIGSQGGDTFFVMELLHGVDVRQLLRRLWKDRATVPVEHAVGIALGMCAGLHYAHEKGIVHRDVSPQNVFLTREGRVKLLDFGIAKAEARLAETSGDGGVLKGKVPYMSPEQARGQHSTLDRRSDVFSTCIVLWELLAGAKLYQGESDFLVLKRIIEENSRVPLVVPGTTALPTRPVTVTEPAEAPAPAIERSV